MTHVQRSVFMGVVLAALIAGPAAAQKKPAEAAPAAEPGRATISLYRIAPGKHLEFLKWMAAREAIDKEVGAPPTQMYAHVDGDSWDFLVINPELTDPVAQAELEKKIQAAAKKKGLPTGAKQAIEIRQYISWHTDTLVRGPMSPTSVVDMLSKP